ncbi:thermonuclease family protein [Melghirimyces algeriensis]|uniref:Endonuclease YncB, thermonuclease family n=1 Tax=Melghirimyces algeriensis TaxID=910412 RepID=A0A521BVD1_9BACL|nr:thermonuclease family protein [Melghirimyces algeriensis]SMO51164.1 Endonuclease YncB, thermonuclease family [Melghirimyces algeriensis]
MKKKISLGCLGFLGILTIIAVIMEVLGLNPEPKDPHPDPAIDEEVEQATVTKVIDGETLEVKIKDNKKKRIVRLALIDTPSKDQPYGKKVLRFLKKEYLGQPVSLSFDKIKKDDQGRLWAYVREFEYIQEDLLERGLARVDVPKGEWESYQIEEMKEEEADAKKERLNIWKYKGYVQDGTYHPDVYKQAKAKEKKKRLQKAKRERERQKKLAEKKKRLAEQRKKEMKIKRELADKIDPDDYLSFRQKRKARSRDKDDDRDCWHFDSWEEAQAFYKYARGRDRHGLDLDRDGIACANLPLEGDYDDD